MIVHKHRAPCYCLVCVCGVLGLQRFCTGRGAQCQASVPVRNHNSRFPEDSVYIKVSLSNLVREFNSEVCMFMFGVCQVYGCACCKKMCRKDEGEQLGADESRTNRGVGQAVHMRNPSRMGVLGL